MRPILAVLSTAFALTLAPFAFAQESAQLGLGEAIQASRERAPAIVTSVARERSVRAEVGVAGMLQSPRVSVGTTTASSDLTWSLYVALPVFGQRGTAIDAAEANAAVAAAGVEVARVDARLAVSVAWIDLWQAEQEATVAADVATHYGRLRDAASGRFEAGGGSRLDVLRAETESRRSRGEAEARKSDADAASARLALLLGVDPIRHIAIAGAPGGGNAVPTDAAVASLVATHPVALQARDAKHAAEAVVVRERRALWPLLGVQVGGNNFNRYPPPNNDYQASIGLDVPIFSKPLVDRAKANQAEARTAQDVTSTTLRAGLADARATYLAADRRYRAARVEVLPVAEEAADLANEAYRSGALDLTATLIAAQTMTDARLAAARAEADRGRAFAALEHAAGRAL